MYAFRDYALIKILENLEDEDLTKCLSEIGERNFSSVLADNELITTARCFLENSLNISETSRVMFIHRNTLIYRLDKIKKETGLNIREFDDAMIFKLLGILTAITNKK